MSDSELGRTSDEGPGLLLSFNVMSLKNGILRRVL